MSTIRHIRTELFGVSQAAFAQIAGTSQAVVSRWENGLVEPSLSDLKRIADEARARRLRFDERLFFKDAPPPAATPAEASQ